MKSIFADSLARLIAGAGDREVVVFSHHPLVTHGPHGGFYDWKNYLWPFPLALPFAKRILKVGAHQDLFGRQYRQMITMFEQAFAAKRPLLMASGHEHSQQVLDGNPVADFLLVSGAGSRSKITPVTDGPETLFAQSQAGYMVVDFMNSRRVLLRVFAVDKAAGTAASVFSLWLR